jgi:hypothetical protein
MFRFSRVVFSDGFKKKAVGALGMAGKQKVSHPPIVVIGFQTRAEPIKSLGSVKRSLWLEKPILKSGA